MAPSPRFLLLETQSLAVWPAAAGDWRLSAGSTLAPPWPAALPAATNIFGFAGRLVPAGDTSGFFQLVPP